MQTDADATIRSQPGPYRPGHDADHAIADLDQAIGLEPNRAFDHYLRGVVR